MLMLSSVVLLPWRHSLLLFESSSAFLEAFAYRLLDPGLALAELWKLTFSVEYFVPCPVDRNCPVQLEHVARQMPH